nr:TetR/AcrR family transcriptional regulator [Micromonospora sp. DSM 115978]
MAGDAAPEVGPLRPSRESGARNRTRTAILSAAAEVLARDRTATLADVAEAAAVGRSTLHRYFPDRDELFRAVVEDSVQVLATSVSDAAIDAGPPLAAMRRLVAAMVDVGDRILFLFGDPRTLENYGPAYDPDGPECDPAAVGQGPGADRGTLDLIERGQAEGVFDPEVGSDWIQSVLWGLVYTGCEAAREGRLPRHGVAATVIRTFENGIARPPKP